MNFSVTEFLNLLQLQILSLFDTGKNDCTRCFHCGGGLKQWAHDDDPFIEHAKGFPDCPYLLQKKGQEFCEQIQSEIVSSSINQFGITTGQTFWKGKAS